MPTVTSPLVGEVESFQAVAIAPSSLDEEGLGGVTRSVAGEKMPTVTSPLVGEVDTRSVPGEGYSALCVE